MANTGKTVATLIIGAALGTAVGFLLGTDKDKRQEQLDALLEKLNGLKDKFGNDIADIEDEIYNG